KYVSLRRVEDTESATQNRTLVTEWRPGHSDPWSPIVLVELDASVWNTIETLCIDHFRGLQIKVSDTPAGRRKDLISQAKIQRQVWSHMHVILNKTGQVPVTRWVFAGQRVLLQELRNPQQQVSKTIPAGAGGWVLSVGSGELEPASRSRGLEKVSLLSAEIDAELQGVFASYPAEGVSDLKYVLDCELWGPE